MKLLGEMTGRPDFAALFYRTTSSISHAGLHGLVQRLDMVSEGPEGRYRARLRGISAGEAAADVSLPIMALVRASSALMHQTGWAASDFGERARELRAILETLMGSSNTVLLRNEVPDNSDCDVGRGPEANDQPRRYVQQRPLMPRAVVVHPGTSHTGSRVEEQNHSAGRARVATVIGWRQVRHRTTFTD